MRLSLGTVARVSSAVKVRPFEPSDGEVCRGLWGELTACHRELYGDPSIGGPDAGAGFDDYVAERGDKRIWVAEESGSVIGFAGLMVSGRRAELEPVVVTAALRGRGVGRALVDAALEAARAESLDQVVVRPVARNQDALAFFHEVGFTALGHVDLLLDLRRPDSYWRPGERLAEREFRF
jgi:N-acetylglutamate synthase-like GNAT family acetyltransferase